MENRFFLNGGVPHPIHFSSMQTWDHHHQLSSSSPMEIQQPTHETFYNNPTLPTPTTDHHNLHFDSALSSIVSSPSASNSNNIIPQNENSFMIRKLIGKLGTIGSSGEILPHRSHQSLVYNNIPSLGNNNNHLVSENNNNIKPVAMNSSVAEFSADPGFAERAAKFSCFGSRSFNGRTSQMIVANNAATAVAAELIQRSTTATVPVMENNGRMSRVSSSSSLKTFGSQMVAMENKNNSPLQERIEASNSQDESTISEQAPNVETGLKPSLDMNSRKRKASSRGKAKDASTPSNPTKGVEGSEDSNAKRIKPNDGSDEGNENNHNDGSVKVEEDSKGEEKQNNKNNNSKPPEPPKDYIHVRARRGQATDSHSLAERVRREKISERMKLLQDLVPGCNKVTGKALMLDEIINYVQSLQRQVEFLSMKLASVNTRMDLSIESLIPKDIFQSNHALAALPHPINFPLDSSATPFYGHQSQQNPVIHNDIIPNGTLSHNSVDPLLDNSLCQDLGIQLPPLNGFNEVESQYPLTFCEDDLHTIVQMGFGQTTNMKSPIQSPSFNGSNQVSEMKVEL